MKNSGECVKCQSKDVLRIPGKAGMYGAGNNIPAGWTIYGYVKVTRFVCTACGYSEEWIENDADLDKLMRKYGGSK